jgi:hypothetical protein
MGNHNQSSRDGRCEQYKKKTFAAVHPIKYLLAFLVLKIQTAHIVEVKALSCQKFKLN